MYIQKANQAETKFEYGSDFRRLYPWQGVVEPAWGSAIASVGPEGHTTRHSHDEKETFIILSGTGMMTVGEETAPVEKGDVIYLPPFKEHTIHNTSKTEKLEVFCLWWDAGKADE